MVGSTFDCSKFAVKEDRKMNQYKITLTVTKKEEVLEADSFLIDFYPGTLGSTYAHNILFRLGNEWAEKYELGFCFWERDPSKEKQQSQSFLEYLYSEPASDYVYKKGWNEGIVITAKIDLIQAAKENGKEDGKDQAEYSADERIEN